MARGAAVLCSNVAVVADSTPMYWVGGRSTLVIEATTYPTTCQLQVQGLSGKWINIGANNTADGVVSLDCPAGQYRLHMVGGTAAAVYAVLVAVPYT